jgi:uncharacterized protein with LGFP repeats
MGAAASWLGFPESSLGQALHPDADYQDFEGGTIWWRPQTGAIAVRVEVAQLPSKSTGLPVTEEMPFGGNPDDRIQFFDQAVATLRDGKREIWFRS